MGRTDLGLVQKTIVKRSTMGGTDLVLNSKDNSEAVHYGRN